MIFTLILNIIYFFFTSLINILPVSTGLPTQINDAINYFLNVASQWTFILPLSTLFTILGYSLLIEIPMWSFFGGIWIYKKIRGN